MFKNQRRISVLGLINNINQQNFTQQELQGIAYRLKSEKIKLSIGTEYQYSILNGYQVFPLHQDVIKVFTNFMPNFELTYKFNKKKNGKKYVNNQGVIKLSCVLYSIIKYIQKVFENNK
jgi:hypothetical protein